jgi:hypothetical protein
MTRLLEELKSTLNRVLSGEGDWEAEDKQLAGYLQMVLDQPAEEPKTFQEELGCLLNRFSKENGCNTPDFILASFLQGALDNLNAVVNAREKWHGREVEPIENQELFASSINDPTNPPEGGTQ